MFNNVGFVGSRPIAQALAHHLVAAQISVLLQQQQRSQQPNRNRC